MATEQQLKNLAKAQAAPRKKRPSMRKAIDAKCKDCIYDPLAGLGTWRQQVQGCTCTDCPLFELRPVPSTKKRQVEHE